MAVIFVEINLNNNINYIIINKAIFNFSFSKISNEISFIDFIKFFLLICLGNKTDVSGMHCHSGMHRVCKGCSHGVHGAGKWPAWGVHRAFMGPAWACTGRAWYGHGA